MQEENKSFNVFSLIGFILSIISAVSFVLLLVLDGFNTLIFISLAVCFVAIIFCGIGITRSKTLGRGKALGIIGLVISIITIVVFLGYLLLVITLINSCKDIVIK